MKKIIIKEAQALGFNIGTYGEVKEKMRVSRVNESDNDLVLIYDGNLKIKGNLQIDYDAKWMTCKGATVVGILILGNLTIDGCLLNYEDDEDSQFLQVDGNLTAHNMATGSAHINVLGTIETECQIVAYNHGSITAATLKCKICASEAHTDIPDVNGYVYTGYDTAVPYLENSVIQQELVCDLSNIFKKTVLRGQPDDQNLDFKKAQSYLAKDKNILYEKFVSSYQKIINALKKKLEHPKKVKKINLSNKGISKFPKELALFTNLEELDISSNNLTEIPESLRQLKKLRILHLNGNKISVIADWIGELTHLEYLNLSFNNQHLTQLPDAIGSLTNLKQLLLRQTALKELPDSLSNCVSLKIVDISSLVHYSGINGPFMITFPEVLTQLPVLEQLDFTGTLISNLPENNFASNTLQVIKAKEVPITTDRTNHKNFIIDIDNSVWPLVYVCKFKLDVPKYNIREKKYDTDSCAARIPAFAQILETATVPLAEIEKRITAAVDQKIKRFDKQGDVAFVIREWFSKSLEKLEKVAIDKGLKTLLIQIFSTYAKYETPVNPDSVFHLLSEKDNIAYQKAKQKKAINYRELYFEKYGKEMPFCESNAVLSVANARFLKNTNVLAWEFNKNLIEENPDDIRPAFVKNSYLKTTDFGFAFESGYWQTND